MSFGKPRPVTLTDADLPAALTTWAAARIPTVVGATMTFRLGYLVSRPLAWVVLTSALSSPYTVSTSLRPAYFGSWRVVFMRAIHAFWLVAVADADRIAISPVQLGASSQAQSARFTPTPLKSTWLTK